ncbi:mitochondrial ATP synthase epsilon chain-domain-containing protein [Fimicolochytrium jonesii]|uniref:mitochondrial ATP synthase epsilon chain-domain-containing protein n=1 Tax=Fimicolochytrium jonesii TaxID=1396493 RepID=UPI0022FDE775|nr:mitochondrial ATP synthase epsilon chain-domain-containing protein [Fimicolochytrium jonesii]XP_052926132.1 mitochondrial ATP synthase epsilon chain-domain-containing protein [Fimicolochytrium jonesii]KAI8817713.1 mitochondrial ATP synthase epsilon chain-domain-containing protein [Fimicolochytrium jonesii]KAI8821643.1 mitochondrial ATP synthase epsilon chain-domain-containing protein [Fimicolochytrium jonesii]
MSFFWREAGMTYLQYANVSAKALRNVLKENAKVLALRREEQYAKVQVWKDGKQGDSKVIDASGNKTGH